MSESIKYAIKKGTKYLSKEANFGSIEHAWLFGSKKLAQIEIDFGTIALKYLEPDDMNVVKIKITMEEISCSSENA